MPELPEVETIRRDLEATLLGRRIRGVFVSLPKMVRDGSVAAFRSAVEGARVISVGRRSKLLLIGLDNATTIVVHLKMTGQLIYAQAGNARSKHERVVFELDRGYELRLNDLRQFGYLKAVRTANLSEELAKHHFGPEVIGSQLRLSEFRSRLAQHPKAHIKTLLVDQTFVAGLGSIYADETLFAALIHPQRRVATLTEAERERLYRAMRRIVRQAVGQRGTSIDSYVDGRGRRGGFAAHLKVYRREGQPCPRCGAPVRRVKMGSRSAYYCERCQR